MDSSDDEVPLAPRQPEKKKRGPDMRCQFGTSEVALSRSGVVMTCVGRPTIVSNMEDFEDELKTVYTTTPEIVKAFVALTKAPTLADLETAFERLIALTDEYSKNTDEHMPTFVESPAMVLYRRILLGNMRSMFHILKPKLEDECYRKKDRDSLNTTMYKKMMSDKCSL
jgi:hypothetical protein